LSPVVVVVVVVVIEGDIVWRG